MSLRTLIALEGGLVESQFLRNRADIANYNLILQFIQNETSSKLDLELKREIHSYDRKELQAMLLKQNKLIEDLKTELEGVYMAAEDGEMRSLTVIEKRLRYASKVYSFLQMRETGVCNYGQKLIERAEPFAKKFVIETLDWRNTPQDDVEWNKQLWKMQNDFAELVGTAPGADSTYLDITKLSSGIAEEVLKEGGINLTPSENYEYDEKTGQPLPNRALWKVSLGLLKLLKLLQLIHGSFLKGLTGNISHKTLASSVDSARVVAHSLAVLDKIVLADGEDANIYISSVFAVLASLLHTPLYINFFSPGEKEIKETGRGKRTPLKAPGPTGRSSSGKAMAAQEEEKVKEKDPEWSWGAEEFSDDFIHERILYWVLTIYHCRCYFVQKMGFFPMESQATGSMASMSMASGERDLQSQDGSADGGDDMDAHTFVSFNRNEYHDLFLAGDYNGLFVLGSPTVNRIYRCVNASVQAYLKVKGAEENLSPTLRNLLYTTLKLGVNSIHAYAFRSKTSQGFNYSDVALIESVESEVCEMLRLTTTALTNGILNYNIIRILRSMFKLLKSRSSNYFLAVSFVQCIHAALLCTFHQRNLPENVKYEADVKAKVKKANLIRTPYIDLLEMLDRKAAFDLLLVTGTHPNSLTIQHTGLTALRLLLRPPFMSRVEIQDMFEDGDDAGGDVLSEGEDEDEEEEEEGAAANVNEFKSFRNKLWKTDIPQKLRDTFGYPTSAWSMTEFIMFCGEVHMQSVEIVEQVLLVVQHLAQVSFLCRITLTEREIEKILNRIVETMPQHVYIMALVEITNETLLKTD